MKIFNLNNNCQYLGRSSNVILEDCELSYGHYHCNQRTLPEFITTAVYTMLEII